MITPLKNRTAYMQLRTLVLLVALLVPALSQAVNPARPLMEKMIVQMGKMLSASAHVKRTERLSDGSMISGEMRFKAMFVPRLKAYIHTISPREGTEVLYVEGWNDNSAYVNPNGFPWINLSLDPEGSSMMEKQHHSLLCIGFRFTEGIVKHIYEMHDDVFDKYVKYVGEQKWNTRMTHVVKINYPDFGAVKYTVQGDENLCQIERKIFVPAAKILEMNPGMEDFWDLHAGQVINVPNFYGKESTFMIDTEHFLPIVQIINDEKGLFERYEYHDLKVNPRFTTTEFTKDFPDYGF